MKNLISFNNLKSWSSQIDNDKDDYGLQKFLEPFELHKKYKISNKGHKVSIIT